MSYVTNSCSEDGFGSQFQYLIELILICYIKKSQFIYTPIQKINHNYDNSENYNEKIEDLMNIRTFFPVIDTVDESTRSKIIATDNGSIKAHFDQNQKDYIVKENIEKIRDMFWQNKTHLVDPFKNNKINVAVHFRRYNIYDDRAYEDRKTYETRYDRKEYFMKIMNDIREEYKDWPVHFHLYTQASVIEFRFKESIADDIENYFKADDVTFHIDTDICDSFIEMVAANILVTGASSFSYIAGFLSKGKVYYRPFWHPPLPEWIVVDKSYLSP
jgi:hypothetical protein